ncbi:hypothetical protein ACFQQB_14400 [Nonomuraea rubra]|uniref:hypothetical protein n=1 Tax=Nonomuraea rubra TaxID=46180 RepID=UPI00362343D7
MTVTAVSVQARWLAVTSVAVGTFTVVTSEMLPVGLLTSMAVDLGVSAGTAGLTMTAPGLVAAAAAPSWRSPRAGPTGGTSCWG